MKWIKFSQDQRAQVDDDDCEAVAKHTWHAQRFPHVWYAYTTIKGRRVSMHQFISPGHSKLDHKDGDGLNNRRKNLRPSTTAQNAQNRRKLGRGVSRYKGVARLAGRTGWIVRPRLNGQRIFVGYFKNELEAALAYDDFARENYGEWACVNFPIKGERSAL